MDWHLFYSYRFISPGMMRPKLRINLFKYDNACNERFSKVNEFPRSPLAKIKSFQLP